MRISQSPAIIALVAVGIVGTGEFAISRAGAGITRDHSPLRRVRLTLPDGTPRLLLLEGVGCSVSLCSTVAIHTRANAGTEGITLLDSILSIRDITPRDALFRFKDGREQRLSVAPDNRFLYLASPDGTREKRDLSYLTSIEFLHHSSVSFDLSRTFTMSGTMTKVDWRNPHVMVSLETKDDSGKVEAWELESGAPPWFRGRNLTKNDLEKAVGQTVTVEGVRAKDGSLYGYLFKITFADGTNWNLR